MKKIIEFVKVIIDFFIKLLGREVFMYLFFGVVTTIINIVCFGILDFIGLATGISTTIANIVSIVFAYITNRKYVFESKAKEGKEILKEIWKFTSVRIGTLVLDLVLMIVLVDYMKFNSMICKVLVNILVIILNYIASKLFVFKKERKN